MQPSSPSTYLRFADGVSSREAPVASETPVALVYNGVPHVVMMTTPADLEDFALGFSISEGFLSSPREMLSLAVEEGESGISVRMEVPPERFALLADRGRNMTGRTGCGLCGVDNLTQVARPLGRVAPGPKITALAVHAALEALPARQAVNRLTGAVHAAAWADPAGRLLLSREDVGRHNALDKLIGAMAQGGIDPATGFAVITSRCSFEMVQKAAGVGITILVAVSAPTALALQIAEQCGMTLIALARSDSINVYASPARIRHEA